MEPVKSKEKVFKGHFVCIKNYLIKIAPFSQGYFDHFLLAFIYSKTIWLQRLNFSCITAKARVGLSSERETATARYVGVDKFIREILIKIAPFHGSKRKFYKEFRKISNKLAS